MMNAHQENYLQMSDYPELIKNIMQINRRGESQGYNYEQNQPMMKANMTPDAAFAEKESVIQKQRPKSSVPMVTQNQQQAKTPE